MTSPTADWSAFPQGYSLLLNEKAQFPQDLSCWRTRVDGSHQLFADTFWIARSTNLERRLHEVRKHPANPLVEDLWACWVHPEPEGGYRLYANGWRGRLAGAPEPAEARERIVWTARSDDGLDWRFDPDPVLCRDHASAPWRPLQGQLHGLLFEPWEPDPDRRWKVVILDRGRPRQPPGETPFTGPTVSIALYTSADGRRWTWEADTSLLRKGSSGVRHTSPQDPFPEGLGDVLQVRWDPVLEKYVAHTKHTVGPDPRFPFHPHSRDGGSTGRYEARVAGWSESDDLVHWSAPRIYAYPDAEDARTPGMYGIYEADGFPYEDMWLGCLSMTANIPDPSCEATPRHAGGFKRNWIRLAGSRDGRHWYYLGDRRPLVPVGPDDGWDAHYLRIAQRTTVAGPVIAQDEVRLYYHGHYGGIPGCKGLTLGKETWQSALGLGVLDRDRFVSLEAGDEPGEVITRPLVFSGAGTLCVNARADGGGSVRAAVLEEDGTPVAGLGFADCAPLEGDSLRAPMSWAGGDSLRPLKDRYVRLAFRLERAGIYSFWIE